MRISVKRFGFPLMSKWAGAELNRRHRRFQRRALPTELPARSNPRMLRFVVIAVNCQARTESFKNLLDTLENRGRFKTKGFLC